MSERTHNQRRVGFSRGRVRSENSGGAWVLVFCLLILFAEWERGSGFITKLTSGRAVGCGETFVELWQSGMRV